MGTKAEIAYHDFLDDLCEREVYSKVVFKIEGGKIKEVIESYIHKPGEILRKWSGVDGKQRRPKVIVAKTISEGTKT